MDEIFVNGSPGVSSRSSSPLVSTDFGLGSCRNLVKTLERGVNTLREELRYAPKISLDLDGRLDWFHQVSGQLSCKLESLKNLPEILNILPEINEKIQVFAGRISSMWNRANHQVYTEYLNIRVASHILAGVPLLTILNHVRKEAHAANVSLQIGEVLYDRASVETGYAIYDEILRLLADLDTCDEKVQQYLTICKITPFLLKLDSLIDDFVAGIKCQPPRQSGEHDLFAFSFAAKLLTGELLHVDNAINPDQVLSTSAFQKPVFIVKRRVPQKRKSHEVTQNSQIIKITKHA